MQRAWYMLALVLAGEAIFALPFHLTRFFRPSVLELFQLSATELGAAQGVYGIFAMLAYFPGGPLADRFPARKLLALSLWLTAAGGLYLATFPGYQGALFIWGFFGVSTILFFWAAMIRACRDWGAADEQGKAFGLLDAGRGALAAILVSLGVLLLSLTFPDGYGAASFDEKQNALRLIIYGYTTVTAAAGVLVWFAIREPQAEHGPAPVRWQPGREPLGQHIARVLRIRAVWLQALIILSAYVGYKGFDNYTLFAVQGYQLDEIEAARIAAIGAWTRPLAALGAGLLGDRFGSARMICWLFALLLASHLFFALGTPIPGAAWAMLGNTLVTCIAIFGFRGLYFALLEESRVPVALTGTAVGFVSLVGFTPDIFVTYVAGRFIDAAPGLAGHQHFFLFLASFAALGIVASFLLHTHHRRSIPPDRASG